MYLKWLLAPAEKEFQNQGAADKRLLNRISGEITERATKTRCFHEQMGEEKQEGKKAAKKRFDDESTDG